MTGLNTDHLLSGESAEQTVERTKNNLEISRDTIWNRMDEIQIPANKLFTSRVVTFLSGVLMVVQVLFPNFSCK